MKGIPVRANGDPVTRTLVYAGDFTQFGNWCMFSRVNRNSRMVRYIGKHGDMRGCRDFDLVYTGTPKPYHEERPLMHEIYYHFSTGSILRTWEQYESCEIEPYVLDDVARQVCAGQGVDCPDPSMHVVLPDGTVGKHAWVMQTIKDAKTMDGRGT